MTFLTFLFFATVVYLCAADPIAETGASDQKNLDKFMAAIEKSYDEDFAVLLNGLSEDNRAYMKTTTLDGVGSFINYCLYRAKQETGLASKKLALDDLNDILMEFDSLDSFYPAVPFEPSVSCQKDGQ